MRVIIILFLSVTLLQLTPLFSHAGGFQINLQGQKQTGMGHCGTGLLLGASNAFFNPGGFAFVDSNRIALGGSFISSNITYLEPYPGIYTTKTISGVGTPITFYSSFKVKKHPKWNMGLAIYTPFGSGIKYEDDWKGQAVIREMALRTIFFQPTVGFRLTEKIGIGAGYVYGTGKFTLRKGLPVQDLQGEYGEGELTGKSSGHGFNVGLFIKASDKLSFGLGYRSSLTVAIDSGDARFTVPSYLEEFFPATTFSTKIKLPQVVSLGVGYNLNEKITLALDVNYVGWSAYDTLSFDFAENTEKLLDINSPRKYDNAFIFRLGGLYHYDKKLTIRAGVYYDLTPVQNGYITPETPDADKIGITTGFSFQFSEHFVADLSFLFIEGKARTDTNKETGFGGTWKAQAFIPGFGIEFIF